MQQVTHDGKQWSNSEDDKIELTEHDSSWAKEYQKEATGLLKILSHVNGLRIEHFGSTAILGLRAKPIIDILIIHPRPDLWPELIEPITSLGYIYWKENPRKDQMFFVKGMPPFGSRRTHHVHVRVPQDAEATLRFRDTLRRDPMLVRQYEILKERLAKDYPGNREAYTNGKTEFISRVLRQS